MTVVAIEYYVRTESYRMRKYYNIDNQVIDDVGIIVLR